VDQDGQVLGVRPSAAMGRILHRRILDGADHAAQHLEICLGVQGRGAVSPDSGVPLALRHLKVSLQLIGSQQLVQADARLTCDETCRSEEVNKKKLCHG
jgi:hypothetical protein